MGVTYLLPPRFWVAQLALQIVVSRAAEAALGWELA